MMTPCLETNDIIKTNIINSVQRDGNWFNEIVYLCVSGSQLYGYSHKESDLDIRGCYVMPIERIIGIGHTRYVLERNIKLPQCPPIDLQVFDIKKEVELVIANNANVYENIFAPPFKTTQEHKLLKAFASMALTTRIYYPFRGTAVSEFEKYVRAYQMSGRYEDITQKHILATFRLLMAGIFVLETGKIESNMLKLCGYFDDKVVKDLSTSQMINGDRSGFRREEIDKFVDKMENYFLHIDLAAQESMELFHDDGTADQKQRAAFKEGVFYAANDLLKKVRITNLEE